MTVSIEQLKYGEELLIFRLERRERKTMSITVHPDMNIEVIAPLDSTLDAIQEKVRKRAPWIRKQLRYFHQFHPRTPDRKFVPGETHLYLGRQYKLKVTHHPEQKVKVYRGAIIVQSHKPRQNEITRSLVESWYREKAHTKFTERLELCRQLFPDPEEFVPSQLIIRQLKQRWGSMTPQHRLILNPSLVKASAEAIDYVITHELCHIKHHHHGPAFTSLMNKVMPDWERRKSKLEQLLA